MRRYSKKLYTSAQAEWCRSYERLSSFEPMMEEFEAGNYTFREAQRWNTQWLVDWAKETAAGLDHEV